MHKTEVKCLIVEDETDIRHLLELLLKREGYLTEALDSAETALNMVKESKFDLIIVDWMLPGISGVELIKKLRLIHTLSPILMLTAKTQPEDIVTGLNAGADDYLTKPFDAPILLARVKALLRRKQWEDNNKTKQEFFELSGIRLYDDRHEVFVEDQKIHLTPSEYKILLEMLKNVGRVLTRDYLISKVQGEGIAVTGRTIDTHVFALRKKLLNFGDLIETIRGIGYRIRG